MTKKVINKVQNVQQDNTNAATNDKFKPGSTSTDKAPAPSAPASAEAPDGTVTSNPQPGVKRGRVFTHGELWATISHVQRVAWLKRAGIIGDPQLVKHARVDWHQLDQKVLVRLLGVK